MELKGSGSPAVDNAQVLIASLAQLGLKHLVFAPGSRSAPLVYAADLLSEAFALKLHVRHDERSAAFTALGLNKAGELAAVVTTSGTASAHLLAAAMESYHSRLPLLLLTADRPKSLRGTGANQTTLQAGLYEPFVGASFDFDAFDSSEAQILYLQDIALRSKAVLSEGKAVHLNLGFSEPLTPAANSNLASAGQNFQNLKLKRNLNFQANSLQVIPTPIQIHSDAVVVVGDADLKTAAAAQAVAEAFELPIFAEPSSNIKSSKLQINAYQLIIDSLALSDIPSQVIVYGHSTLSRAVQRKLLANTKEIIVVDPAIASGNWPDPQRKASWVIAQIDIENSEKLETKSSNINWHELGEEMIANSSYTAQATAALAVWEACQGEDKHTSTPLVLGASSLIRDLEKYAGPSHAPVFANRGLAGIDGTFAFATGVALALTPEESNQRTRVLVGDISAIHDLNSLILGPYEQQPNIDFIVVDDNGGRIFKNLEHSEFPAVLDRFFITAHNLDLTTLFSACNIETTEVSAFELKAVLAQNALLKGRRAYVVKI